MYGPPPLRVLRRPSGGRLWIYAADDSFDEFLRDKAAVWAGTDSEFAEVEAAHGEDELVGRKVDGYPDFGHNMKQYWPFASTCE